MRHVTPKQNMCYVFRHAFIREVVLSLCQMMETLQKRITPESGLQEKKEDICNLKSNALVKTCPAPKAWGHRMGALEQQGGGVQEAADRCHRCHMGDGDNSPKTGRAGRYSCPHDHPLKAVLFWICLQTALGFASECWEGH